MAKQVSYLNDAEVVMIPLLIQHSSLWATWTVGESGLGGQVSDRDSGTISDWVAEGHNKAYLATPG